MVEMKPHIARVILCPFPPQIYGWGVWENITRYVKQDPPLMQVTTLSALKACYSGWPKVNKEK